MIDSHGFLVFVIVILALLGVIFIFTLKGCIEMTKLPGGRYFGFNCDGCKRKFDSKGRLFIRCHIKPKIVYALIKYNLITDRTK